MEVRGILQTIGMEAAALSLLFGLAFIAIRITVAERRAQPKHEDSFATIPTEQQPF